MICLAAPSYFICIHGRSVSVRLCHDKLSSLVLEGVNLWSLLCFTFLSKRSHRTVLKKKKQTCTITPPALTLCTVWPFVTDGAHAVSISAGAVAAAKRVYALCDRDVAFGSFPAAVTHTGALVVLAVAAAQHRACRCRNRETERLNPAHKNKPNKQTKKKKQLASFLKDRQSGEKCTSPTHADPHPTVQEGWIEWLRGWRAPMTWRVITGRGN